MSSKGYDAAFDEAKQIWLDGDGADYHASRDSKHTIHEDDAEFFGDPIDRAGIFLARCGKCKGSQMVLILADPDGKPYHMRLTHAAAMSLAQAIVNADDILTAMRAQSILEGLFKFDDDETADAPVPAAAETGQHE